LSFILVTFLFLLCSPSIAQVLYQNREIQKWLNQTYKIRTPSEIWMNTFSNSPVDWMNQLNIIQGNNIFQHSSSLDTWKRNYSLIKNASWTNQLFNISSPWKSSFRSQNENWINQFLKPSFLQRPLNSVQISHNGNLNLEIYNGNLGLNFFYAPFGMLSGVYPFKYPWILIFFHVHLYSLRSQISADLHGFILVLLQIY